MHILKKGVRCDVAAMVRPFQGLPDTIQPITELVTIIQERQVTALAIVRGKRSNHLGDAKDICCYKKITVIT